MHLKKELALLCAVCLLFSLCPLSILAAPAADTQWYTGTGSYTLTTAEQLAGLAELVNGGNELYGVTIRLGASISLSGHSWTPIGDRSTDASVFSGTFSGGGYSVTGLSVSGGSAAGLFGYVSTSGSISDLTVSGSVSGADYVGGIVGYCNGSISGCSFSGTVSGANSVGGIAGLSAGSISKCSAAGNISGRSYVGGITGHQYGGSIAASSNSAAVTGTGSYTGGITGNAERCTLSDCTNTGSISGDTAAGGIAGYGQSASIQSCTGDGGVTGAKQVGGILGLGSSGSIANCAAGASVSGQDAGGIAGTLRGGSVQNSFSSGAVSGSGSGGVAGHLSGSARLKNCYASGSVSGSGSGGIAGTAAGGSVSGCYWRSDAAASAAGDGNLSACAAFSAGEDNFWPLDTPVGGHDELLDALNAGSGEGMRRWYVSGAYPAFSGRLRLTVTCTDKDEHVLKVVRTLLSAGESYALELPKLDGMTTEKPVLTGVMPDESTTVSVVYVGDKHKLTVEFYFEDGPQALEPIEQETLTGSVYTVECPPIEGYTPDPTVVTGTMPAQDTVIRVTYRPAQFTGSADGSGGTVGPETEAQQPQPGAQAPAGSGRPRGVRLNFFFWLLVVLILLGLAILIVLLSMLLHPGGRIARWANNLLYPQPEPLTRAQRAYAEKAARLLKKHKNGKDKTE